MIPLPIDGILPSFVDAVRARGAAVLRAETGAGKTTRVPGALYDAGFGRVVMLEPRRIAARAAARRIAEERRVRLGHEVGWHVRFDRHATDDTGILVVTEGLLVRMLQDDPFLERWGVVVLDEFHERSLHGDLALAMVQRVRRDARPDLKLVVMSATLDPGPVAAFIDGADLTATGRTFPVDVRYAKFPDARPVEDQVADGVRAALASTDGHVLAFLPGVREIHRTAERLANLGVPALRLYGDLPADEQDAVLTDGPRKVVLATNVAETSLTVPGVGAVVDGGWHRVMVRDAATGLDRLETRRVARANAEQRSGRAGRQRPGVCLRLWTEREHAGLDERIEPEIARVDLASPVLELLCWGERDVATFPWFEAPPPDAITAALRLLDDLGRDLGNAMRRFPLHPRLARMVIEGHRLGHVDAISRVAALLSERIERSGPATHRSESDVLDLLDRAPTPRSADAIRRVANELGPQGPRVDRDEAVLRAVLSGFPDRVARMRAGEGRRALLVGGRGVRLDGRSAVDAPLFVAVDVDAGARGALAEGVVRVASAVDEAWLPVRSEVDVEFDEANGRVAARRRRRYRDLVLSEQTAPTPEDVSDVLAEAAGRHLDRVLPDAIVALVARARWLAGSAPDLGVTLDDDALRAILPGLCAGRRSFEELRRAEWIDAVPWATRQALDRYAPTHLPVPSGSSIALTYEVGRAPVLAVRMQELFGLADTPRVADGRVKVVLHLLGPNGRPQQVTDDLRSFWNTTWPEIRKELRARYPRHAWPEDPWNAPPERRPKRRTS